MATRQRICRIRVLAKNLPFLSNLSTRQNGLFEKLVGLAKFAYIRQPVFLGLAKLAKIRQTILLGLARLAKGKFGIFYANLVNLASLASLANLASVDSPDSPSFAKGHFWKNVTRIRHICTSNLPFSQIWGKWPLLSTIPHLSRMQSTLIAT
jgi:hypothetical protein